MPLFQDLANTAFPDVSERPAQVFADTVAAALFLTKRLQVVCPLEQPLLSNRPQCVQLGLES